MRLEGLAEDFLGVPGRRAINVGAVEVGDAHFDALVDDRLRAGLVHLASQVVTAQPQRRHDKAGTAEILVFHETPLQ